VYTLASTNATGALLMSALPVNLQGMWINIDTGNSQLA
jgi:hypothetical protein